jgi:hypothetical protein
VERTGIVNAALRETFSLARLPRRHLPFGMTAAENGGPRRRFLL